MSARTIDSALVAIFSSMSALLLLLLFDERSSECCLQFVIISRSLVSLLVVNLS